jgi:large conductance mechanosensitive channel
MTSEGSSVKGQPGGAVGSVTNRVKRHAAVSEFREFLKNYNVVGMAIGIVMGAAVTRLVNSVVQSLVMPLINLGLPRGDWEKAGFVLRKAVVEEGTEVYPAVKILYGDIISTGLNFIIIAIVVFLFAKYILREEKVAKK